MTCWPSAITSWLRTTAAVPLSIDASAAKPEGQEGEKKKKKKEEEEEEEEEELTTMTTTTKPKEYKVRKIRLFPTSLQKAVLAKWFGASRWTYNQCEAGVKDGSVKRTMTALRKRYLNQKDVPDLPLRVLETPFDVRDEGMRDLVKAYASNLAKHRKQKKRLKFEVQFRSKKDPQESIVIHSKHWVGPGRFYPSILKKCLKKEIADREEWKRKQKLLDDFRGRQCGLELLLKWRKGRRKRCAHWIPLQTQRQKGRTPKKKRGKTSKRERRGRVADAKPTGLEDELTLRGAEPLPEVLPSDSRLIRTRWGKYYLAIPMPLEGSNNQAPSSSRVPKVVAIDPGVRTFGTCYVAPEGKAYEWGRNDIGRIYRICHYLDDLQSRWGQPGVKARQRYRM
ncbi:Transposase [Balamuthia mandrillaris]